MKPAVIREMTTEEIIEKISDETTLNTKLRMTHAISPLENPLQLNLKRKVIARLKTELKSRQLKSQSK
jgi:large subunit ribosomal protein L29